MYVTTAEARHASLSLFVVTVNGALGHEAVLFSCVALLECCLQVGRRVLVKYRA